MHRSKLTLPPAEKGLIKGVPFITFHVPGKMGIEYSSAMIQKVFVRSDGTVLQEKAS